MAIAGMATIVDLTIRLQLPLAKVKRRVKVKRRAGGRDEAKVKRRKLEVRRLRMMFSGKAQKTIDRLKQENSRSNPVTLKGILGVQCQAW